MVLSYHFFMAADAPVVCALLTVKKSSRVVVRLVANITIHFDSATTTLYNKKSKT